MIRTRDQAQNDLADVAPLLDGAIRAALQRFTDEHKPQRHYYSPRTQASVIHDLMVQEARRAVAGVAGVKCMVIKGGFVLLVRQTYVIKLKKMDGRLRTKNVPTQTVIDFNNQKPLQMDLPDVPPETHLVFGYVPHGAELLKSAVWVTCPKGRRHRWVWMVEKREMADVVPFASRAADAGDAPLFKLKDLIQSDKKNNDGNDG